MSDEQLTWHPSKVDWWLAVALFVPPGAVIAVCVGAVRAGSTTDLLVGLAAAAFVAVVYRALVFPVRYGVGDTHLVVQFGMCRRRIPLTAICEVRPTRNPLSSPALSLDRLCVRYGEGVFQSVLISPAERSRFLDELALKAGLSTEGEILKRV